MRAAQEYDDGENSERGEPRTNEDWLLLTLSIRGGQRRTITQPRRKRGR
jgi:hypothetical protein